MSDETLRAIVRAGEMSEAVVVKRALAEMCVTEKR